MKGLSIIRLNKHLYKEKFVPHQYNNIKCEKTGKDILFFSSCDKVPQTSLCIRDSLIIQEHFCLICISIPCHYADVLRRVSVCTLQPGIYRG